MGLIRALPFGKSFTQSWPYPAGARDPSRIRFTDQMMVTVSPGRYALRSISRFSVHVRMENCCRSYVRPDPLFSIQFWSCTSRK